MTVTSFFDLIMYGTDDSAMNIIIYKEYILLKADLKHKHDMDSPWHWLQLELYRCSGHSSAILLQDCKVNFVKYRCIPPPPPKKTLSSTVIKFSIHIVEGFLYLLPPSTVIHS
jgi:hypothetical protein